MATTEQIARFKQIIGKTTMTDEQLGEIIDQAEGNLDEAARWYWRMMAAEWATIVNVSESGSSRSMSDMFKHALELAKFDPGGGDVEPPSTGRTRTRRIVRE